MKQLIAFALLVTLLSFSIPVTAQKRGLPGASMVKRASAEFERVEAVTDGTGAFVRWRMKEETDNAGFIVLRQGANGFERVGDVVPGSAARSRRSTVYGEVYDLYDPDGTTATVYVVRSLAMDGREVTSDPAAAVYAVDPARVVGRLTDPKTEGLPDPTGPKTRAQLETRSLALPNDLAEQVRSELDTPDLATHRWVVSQPGAKIAVRQEGFYRVSRAQLEAAGFDVASDSKKWRLFADGVEQSIIVGGGDQYIEFYGKPIDTIESDTHIYYLLADTTDGKRIANKVMSNFGGTVQSQTYRAVTEKRERTNYISSIINGDLGNFWGRIVTSQATTFNFNLSGVDTAGGPATFDLKMHGFSATVQGLNAVLNGHPLPQALGNGPFPFSVSGEIPASFLVEGNNTLQMNTDASNQFSVFDSITINFARRYRAEQNKVSFHTPGYRKVDVGNFSTANVRIFETTYDGDPILLTNVPIVQEGGTFTAKIPSHRAIVAYGVEDSGLLQSPAVTPNVGSTLSTSSNAANLIIISHSATDFMTAAETWADYRRSATGGSFTVKVVDVADVYDEFNYGSASAAAINAFLNYAVDNWTTPPQYVMLLGDASYDPRNYLGLGYLDLIPTKIVPTFEAESGSDEALADFNNDGLAEIAIGRIPARTVAVINTIFNKTTLFETPAMQSLARGGLFVHDLPIGYDFQGMNQLVRDEVPTMPATMVARRYLPSPPAAPNTPDPHAQQDIINGVNSGKFIVNYAGHGTTGLWAHASFFGIDNVPQLTNAGSPTIFTMLTCLNGYFLRPDADSIGELLLKASNGGSVASWASTAKTTPDIQLPMGARFYNHVNSGAINRMGEMIRDAKTVIPGSSDVRYSWVLLGDPALKVR